MKTIYLLATRLPGRNVPFYVQHLTTRTWDQRKLIELTDNPDNAKFWLSEAEALETLAKCITNDRQYEVLQLERKFQPEKPIVFSERAEKAKII